MGERAGAGSVTDSESVSADRPWCGAPELAGRFLLEIDHLTHRIAHGIVVPGRGPEEVAVLGPGTPPAPLGHDEAAVGVGDDIGPGSRRSPTVTHPDQVIAVGRHAAVAVVQCQLPVAAVVSY